jgi:hypothetical protein
MAATLKNKEEKYAFAADLGFVSDFIASPVYKATFNDAVRKSRRMTDVTCRLTHEAAHNARVGSLESGVDGLFYWDGGSNNCNKAGSWVAVAVNEGRETEEYSFTDCNDDSQYAAYACAVESQPLACDVENDSDCDNSNWAYYEFGGGEDAGAADPVWQEDENGYDDMGNANGNTVHSNGEANYVNTDVAWTSELDDDVATFETQCPDWAAKCGGSGLVSASTQKVVCATMSANFAPVECYGVVSSSSTDVPSSVLGAVAALAISTVLANVA